MRPARNLLLAATTAIAAITFMATTASAQSIEVHPEGSSTHCTDVEEGASHTATGGCLIHAISEDNMQFVTHTGTQEVVTIGGCSSEFSARINEDGSGYILVNDASFNTGVGACLLTPCDEEGAGGELTHPELEWPISGIFEYGNGQEAMVMNFCIRPAVPHESESNDYCTMIVGITQIASHRQELSAADAPCFEDNGVTEVSGHWVTEAVPNTGVGEVEVQMEHIHYP